MSVRLSDRNDVVILAARGMHHKHHHAVLQPQGLQATLGVGHALVFACDGETREHSITRAEDADLSLIPSQLAGDAADASDLLGGEAHVCVGW
jgi:hypothetical protein